MIPSGPPSLSAMGRTIPTRIAIVIASLDEGVRFDPEVAHARHSTSPRRRSSSGSTSSPAGSPRPSAASRSAIRACTSAATWSAACIRTSWHVRLGGTDLAAAQALDGARPFEPMPGRPMTGFTVLPAAVVDDDDAIRDWVGRAVAFGATLPPKSKTTRRRRRRRSRSRPRRPGRASVGPPVQASGRPDVLVHGGTGSAGRSGA